MLVADRAEALEIAFGGGRTPVEPAIGSTMTAAILSAPRSR